MNLTLPRHFPAFPPQKIHAMKCLATCIWLFLALQTVALPAAEPADPSEKYPNLNLIPWPKTLELAQGRMRLESKIRIVAAQAELRPLAEILAGELSRAAGLKPEVVSGAGQTGDIVLAIDQLLKADEPIHAVRQRRVVQTTDGAYTLVITDRAVVTGFDYRAVAEGTATLLQAVSRDTGGFVLARAKGQGLAARRLLRRDA